MKASLTSGTILLSFLVVQFERGEGGIASTEEITLVTYLEQTTAEVTTKSPMPNAAATSGRDYSTSKGVTTPGETSSSEPTISHKPSSTGASSVSKDVTSEKATTAVNTGGHSKWVLICSITAVSVVAILSTIYLIWLCFRQIKLRRDKTMPVMFQLTPRLPESHESDDTLGLDNPLYNIDLELTKIQLGPSI